MQASHTPWVQLLSAPPAYGQHTTCSSSIGVLRVSSLAGNDLRLPAATGGAALHQQGAIRKPHDPGRLELSAALPMPAVHPCSSGGPFLQFGLVVATNRHVGFDDPVDGCARVAPHRHPAALSENRQSFANGIAIGGPLQQPRR